VNIAAASVLVGCGGGALGIERVDRRGKVDQLTTAREGLHGAAAGRATAKLVTVAGGDA
jgi:hypothetical protein